MRQTYLRHLSLKARIAIWAMLAMAVVVTAGTSLALEGLDVHAAAFRWRLDDREGAGAYELWLRSEPEPA